MINQILPVAEIVFIKLAQGNSLRARLKFGEVSVALHPDLLGSALHQSRWATFTTAPNCMAIACQSLISPTLNIVGCYFTPSLSILPSIKGHSRYLLIKWMKLWLELNRMLTGPRGRFRLWWAGCGSMNNWARLPSTHRRNHMVAGTFNPSTEGWKKADSRGLLPSYGLQGQQVISFKTNNNNKIVFKMIDWMLICLHTHLRKCLP